MSEKSKVLVVDDKQVERVMMKRILSGTYEVIEAENGKEDLRFFMNEARR